MEKLRDREREREWRKRGIKRYRDGEKEGQRIRNRMERTGCLEKFTTIERKAQRWRERGLEKDTQRWIKR